jgi:hypothetical protein
MVAVDGVEAEIIRIYGEWPERYTALVFESSDQMPDHTTTWDRVSGQQKTGSWLAGRGSLTLRGARKKGRALLVDYIAANPQQAAELAVIVVEPIDKPGPRLRPSDLT